MKAYKENSHFYYEKLFNKYNNLTDIYSLITHLQDKNPHETETEIRFLDSTPAMETHPKSVLKSFGKPHYKTDIKQFGFDTKIFFYKKRIGKQNAKIKLHFHNNGLFFYNYAFTMPNNDKRKIIRHALEDKYLKGKFLDFQNDYIIDHNQTVISFFEDVDFHINYIFSIDSYFYQKVSEIMAKKHRKKRRSEASILQLYL